MKKIIATLAMFAFATSAFACQPQSGKTRAEVKAEFAEFKAQYPNAIDTENGWVLNAEPVKSTVTREEVKAELAAFNKLFPKRNLSDLDYPHDITPPFVSTLTREEVRAELRKAIEAGMIFDGESDDRMPAVVCRK